MALPVTLALLVLLMTSLGRHLATGLGKPCSPYWVMVGMAENVLLEAGTGAIGKVYMLTSRLCGLGCPLLSRH